MIHFCDHHFPIQITEKCSNVQGIGHIDASDHDDVVDDLEVVIVCFGGACQFESNFQRLQKNIFSHRC